MGLGDELFYRGHLSSMQTAQLPDLSDQATPHFS